MGKKSDKKVKSDRINVLRKQYDTFLEEDRKRKERNDYILGRLDNMRYLSAAQARHKPILCAEVTPVPSSGACLPERLDHREFHTSPPDHNLNRSPAQNLHIDTAKNFSDISTLLKEITKKYILIPKSRNSIVNDYVSALRPQSLPTATAVPSQQTDASNEDWKSKYDILEKLKKKQNEDIYDENDELYPVKEKQTVSKDDPNNIVHFSLKQDDEYKPQESGDGYGFQNYNKEHITKYEHEVAEKDLTSDKARAETESLNIEAPKISDNKELDGAVDQAPNISPSGYTNLMSEAFDDNKSQNQNINNSVPVEGVPNTNDIEQNSYHSNYSNENVAIPKCNDNQYTNQTHDEVNDLPKVENDEQYEQPIEMEGNYPDPKNVYLDPDDYSPIQVLETPELVEQIHIEPATDTAPPTNDDVKEDEEVYQYPVEMLNVQDFTPANDVKLTDGENVNPKYSAKEQNIEPVIEEPQAEISNDYQNYIASEENVQPTYENDPQAVVAESDPQYSAGIEAFEAEQREMFYEETPEYNYDQQQAETYNQDYNAPAQDYTYYESPAALQEQEYPVEINEHEESNARYDQNYEQQYGTEYEQYGQPQGYDQNGQQHYEQADQPYQDYEYQQPDNNTVHNIEQALDHEAGYDEQNYQATEQVQPAATH